MTLTENQQRSVNAIATVVEKKLEELENALLRNQQNARGIRILHECDLTANQQREIQMQIDGLYKLLREYCEQFNVPKEGRSLQMEIQVDASFLWEELSGSNAKTLTGFKEMEPETIKQYDQFINGMIDATNNIMYHSNKMNTVSTEKSS
jgi:Mg2+ and Co2+ transporter CorA